MAKKVYLEYEKATEKFPLGTYKVRIGENSAGNNFSAIELGANYFIFHGEYSQDTGQIRGEPLDTVSVDKRDLATSILHSKSRSFGERCAESLDAEFVDTTPYGNRNKPGRPISTRPRL